MKELRRRKYLVNNTVQIRYMSLIAVPILSLLAGLYYLMYYAVMNQILIPEAIAMTLLPAMKMVNLVVACTLPIALVVLIRMALVYSNRIVGPIPRIERDLDRIIAGDSSVRLKTRDND